MNCPNCGFEGQNKRDECPKCGIVFAKFNPRPKKPGKLLLTSKIPSVPNGLFAKFICPVAIGKIYVEAVYRKILGMIWDELFKGKTELDQTGNFIAFALFCIFSFLMYHIEEYTGFIILILASVWLLDVLLAKHQYRNCKRNDLIRLLESPQGTIILRKISPEGDVEYAANLNPSEVDHISILQVDRKGGAFQEKVATVWQSSVRFNDESELLLSEDDHLFQAIKKARYVSKLIGVQFKFKYNQDNETATESIKKSELGENIKVELKDNSLKISTKWTSNMRLGFILQILKESGFFLFLLIVAGVMIKFGGLLIFLYDRFYGSGMPSVNMEFSFFGILSVFEPDWDAVDIGEYALAMVLIIRKTLLLAQPQYVSIDSALTRYYINDTLAGECKTGEIDNISLLTNPEPAIVVLNSNSSLEVRNLKSMKEFNSFFHEIREGIEKFIVTPDKAGINAATRIAFNPEK
jgi:hypothetical protein